MKSPISTSSWGAAGWCGRTSSYGSWWHEGEDEPNHSQSQYELNSHAGQVYPRRPEFGSRTYVALAADALLAVVLGGKSLERGFDDTTTETEDKVKGGLL